MSQPRIMQSRIDVTVAAIVEREQRFLVVEERVKGRNVFNQPAGHLEQGESLIDAVIRETREETGFAFEPAGLIGIYLWHCAEAERTFLRVAFTGEVTGPDAPHELEDGIVAVHWLSRNQLLSHERELRSPLVIRSLDDFRAGIRHSLDCLTYLPADSAEIIKLA